MRCLACNCRLTEFEATQKYASSGDPLDLCGRCRRDLPSDVIITERADLDNGDSTKTDQADEFYPEES